MIYIAGTCKRYDGLWLGLNVKKSKCLTALHWNNRNAFIILFPYEATVFKNSSTL